MQSKLTILSISDIHLGNPRVPAEFIIDNLNTAIPDDKTMASVDLLVLAGDVFDAALMFNDGIINAVELWIVRLLRLCSKWDIVLRVLYGTPSHDREQSKHFIQKASLLNIDVDVKYIDTLLIEHIDRFDIDVLYVPDEYHSSTEVTWNEVQELLIMHSIKKVDYAVMHGMFEHQLPNGIKLPCHRSEDYLSIVKKYIFIGHIHKMSVNKRILAQGSFDRLCHGEEEEKGFWRVVSYKNGFDSDEIKFIINKGAKIFKTISWAGLNDDKIRDSLKIPLTFPHASYIQIETFPEESKIALYQSFVKEYPYYNWSIKRLKDNIVNNEAVKLVTFNPVPINPNTIEGLVLEKLKNQGVENTRYGNIIRILESVK